MSRREQAALWSASETQIVPASAGSADEIVGYATQLSQRDTTSIISAFEAQHYEMMTTFLWSKTIAALKKQVASLGAEFVGEVLGRTDITQSSDVVSAVSDYEAITLAEDLGMLTPTDGMRMRQSLEIISHFATLDSANPSDEEMHQEDAVSILRTCVKSVLAHPSVDVAVQFVSFRKDLESRALDPAGAEVAALASSPYFFKKTTISMLLALLRTKQGAQLEHVIGNTNILVPIMWPELKGPERWQLGRAYAGLSTEGQKTAAIGLKNALVKVNGFDYVPEALRSSTFSAAARDVLDAHEGMNNFYNEPEPMRILCGLGTAIPKPAFPICMTAVLCVRLGNIYGVSNDAQDSANELLDSLRPEQWIYLLNECLSTDRRILEKLTQDRPIAQWVKLCIDEKLVGLRSLDRFAMSLLAPSARPVRAAAKSRLAKLGRSV